jgi:hypothetical protein
MHYALAKPTKEALYTALPDDVQYRAKPALDTIVNRLGSLVGAGYFALCLALDVPKSYRRAAVLVLSAVWSRVALHMGRLSSAGAIAEVDAGSAAPPRAPVTEPRALWMRRSLCAGIGASDTSGAHDVLWLVVFCVTGVGLGMTFELLQMHAGP